MFRGFLDSVLATARDPQRIEAVAYVDEDDPTGIAIGHPAVTVRKVIGPQVSMGAANSACLAHSSGEVIVLANDDVIVRTPGWDDRLRTCHSRFVDGIYLAWPNDGFRSYRISTFPILSRRACELLGDPYPDVYRSAFIDTELLDIFMRLKQFGHDRMVYLRDVVFEHHHHRTGKRPRDETSRRHRRFDDDGTFVHRVSVRKAQAQRLMAALGNRPVPALPPMSERTGQPASAAHALASFWRAFLNDDGLPLSRRVYLFVHFCGRYAAARL